MSRGYPATLVAVLCIVSFFAGRFFQLPGLPDATGRGPTTVYKNNRKSLAEVQDKSLNTEETAHRRGGLPLQDERFEIAPHLLANQNFTSFEELLEASGMLANHPPLLPGATGHSFYTMQPMQLLSWYPRAYIFPKFMDRAKCEHVKKIAEARLTPSSLALKKGETLATTREIRTSQGTFMSRGDDPEGVLAWIEDKIAVLTGIPAGHGEAFNILRYETGQHYDSHYDAFTEEDYGKQNSHRVRGGKFDKSNVYLGKRKKEGLWLRCVFGGWILTISF
jgi:prolyl 4-hydroxylase